VGEEFNYRQDLPEIKKMADSLEKNGQLQPIVVSNGGTEDAPYKLHIGGRRMAAYELLGWQNKEIRAEIRAYKESEPLQPYFDNWTSNEDIESTNVLDRAEFVAKLKKGFPLEGGETAPPLEVKEIRERLNLKSDDQVRRLLNIFDHVDADVQKKARKANAPLRLLIAISRIEGTGKDKDAQEENKAALQMKRLDAYLEEQKALEEEGRKTKVRSDKGEKKPKKGADGDGEGGGGASTKPLVNPTKKVNEKGHTAALYLAARMLKVAGASAAEAEALKLQLETVKFFTGGRKTFPGLSAADLKAAVEADEQEEEEEATEEVEE
jgi:hypothetical protein